MADVPTPRSMVRDIKQHCPNKALTQNNKRWQRIHILKDLLSITCTLPKLEQILPSQSTKKFCILWISPTLLSCRVKFCVESTVLTQQVGVLPLWWFLSTHLTIGQSKPFLSVVFVYLCDHLSHWFGFNCHNYDYENTVLALTLFLFLRNV